MKKLLPILILLFTSLFIGAQNNEILIPFYKDNKWGYCDENMNVKINPTYSYAEPFYNGVGLVQFKSVDTNWTDYPGGSYVLYDNITNALINEKNELLIKPFIGSIEFHREYFICRYGQIIWTQDYNPDNGESLYFFVVETDSGMVMKYSGDTLIPARNGEFYNITEHILKWEKRNRDDENEPNTEYFYDGKLFWVSSADKEILQLENCNDECCWFFEDTITVAVNFNGNKTQKFNHRLPLLDEQRQFDNYTDVYRIYNSNGDTVERGGLWLPSFENYQQLVNEAEKEKWRKALLESYKFENFYILSNQKNSKYIVAREGGEYDNNIYLINKTNTFQKYGPFKFISSFYNGFAIVMCYNDVLRQINEKGEFTDLKIDLSNVFYETFIMEDPLLYSKILFLINEKQNNKDNFYYMRVDGKKYIIK
jgi:hypothetical protein